MLPLMQLNQLEFKYMIILILLFYLLLIVKMIQLTTKQQHQVWLFILVCQSTLIQEELVQQIQSISTTGFKILLMKD